MNRFQVPVLVSALFFQFSSIQPDDASIKLDEDEEDERHDNTKEMSSAEIQKQCNELFPTENTDTILSADELSSLLTESKLPPE